MCRAIGFIRDIRVASRSEIAAAVIADQIAD
jgi:hypothetical protein